MSEPLRSIAADFTQLTITSPDYSDKSPAEARAAIKKVLDRMAFGANTEPVNFSRASAGLSAGFNGDFVTSRVVVSGVTWLTGNVDGSDNTGPIIYGKPVVVDTTTGRCVTGINEQWGSNEYKVVGLALANLQSGVARIPVLLGVSSAAENFAVLAKCRSQTSHPSIQDWSEADAGSSNQICVWEFQLPTNHEFNEGTVNQWLADSSTAGTSHWAGAASYVKAFNLDRTYVYKNAYCLLHNTGKGGKLQFYFNFQMSHRIIGTLDADLKKDDSALISIDLDFLSGLQGGKVKVFDKMLSTGKKLKSGVKIIADLARKGGTSDEDSADPFVWRYYVTQATDCPVTDS